MERGNLILPECLRNSKPFEIDVRAAGEELYNSVKDEFEKLRIAAMKSRVDAQRYVLD